MNSIQLASISVYPIKSTRGIEMSSGWVESLGLAFDRRYVVTTPDGQFITARTEPKLCLIQANVTATGLVLTAPDMPVLKINHQHFSQNYQTVNVWKDSIESQHCHQNYDNWFSQYLQKPCQLYYFGEKSERLVEHHSSQVGFADGYPLLLISNASLNDLNQRLHGHTVTMSQFRPNIVVDNCAPFEEDTWQHIRIGEVEFEVSKACSRCVFTTINPATAELHSHQEPLATLKSYRQVAGGDVMFGQNLVPLNEGRISRGDTVEVIKTQSPPTFTQRSSAAKQTNQASAVSGASASTKPKLNFDSWNKIVTGNNKQSILEQGEDAGLLLPYSCRGGMCGRCKIKLDSGDVRQLSTDGLSDEDIAQGYVLACSAIPMSDVTLSKPERKPRREA